MLPQVINLRLPDKRLYTLEHFTLNLYCNPLGVLLSYISLGHFVLGIKPFLYLRILPLSISRLALLVYLILDREIYVDNRLLCKGT